MIFLVMDLTLDLTFFETVDLDLNIAEFGFEDFKSTSSNIWTVN